MLKELWILRFAKLVAMEKEAYCFYRKLLVEKKKYLEGTRAEKILQGIMEDEMEHIRIANELLRIARRQDVEE